MKIFKHSKINSQIYNSTIIKNYKYKIVSLSFKGSISSFVAN